MVCSESMRFVGLETSETRERKDRRTRARLMRKNFERAERIG